MARGTHLTGRRCYCFACFVAYLSRLMYTCADLHVEPAYTGTGHLSNQCRRSSGQVLANTKNPAVRIATSFSPSFPSPSFLLYCQASSYPIRPLPYFQAYVHQQMFAVRETKPHGQAEGGSTQFDGAAGFMSGLNRWVITHHPGCQVLSTV